MSNTREDTERLLARLGGTLLRVAIASIEHGFAHGRALSVDPADYEPPLRVERASFVTLTLEGKLRGCIGKISPCVPLVNDVAENAYAAAFDDNRFETLSADQADRLDIEISVLSDREPIAFAGESDLLAKLRPGTDGLILEHGDSRGLFLPVVWEKLPEPREFLDHLKAKAGFPEGSWPDGTTAYRFATASTSLSARGAVV